MMGSHTFFNKKIGQKNKVYSSRWAHMFFNNRIGLDE